jgi:RimJ/RimL family protein N-acetyltransferase
VSAIPLLATPRLALRPFTPADAPIVEQLAGAWEVADTTLNIPHPYPPGGAVVWIATHTEQAAQGLHFTWAITDRSSNMVYGAIGLHLTLRHQRGELGYWLGVPYWGRGYTSEAALAVRDYAFATLKLNRLVAYHFARNPASGRVMQKIGMRYEGLQRQHLFKDDHFEDSVCYGLLRAEWAPQ